MCRSGAFGRLSAALLLAVLLSLVGCTSQPPSTQIANLVQSSAGPVPPADEQAIRSTIDELNDTAGAAVADQQTAFAVAVGPSSAALLADCPAATTTVRFLPVYSGLRLTPDWSPAKGELTGTVYALPTLVRIYTGDRLTATDLTTLHLGVASGEAFLTPLCIN